jgi:hypothetical protein
MNQTSQTPAQYSVKITGGVREGSQVAVGSHISQQIGVPLRDSRPTREDLEQALAELKQRIAAEAPAEEKAAALERAGELEEAVKVEKPDQGTLTTMEYVKNWFIKHLPGLAGAVMSVIVHPIVGKLVEAGGDALVAEFNRRFGT